MFRFKEVREVEKNWDAYLRNPKDEDKSNSNNQTLSVEEARKVLEKANERMWMGSES